MISPIVGGSMRMNLNLKPIGFPKSSAERKVSRMKPKPSTSIEICQERFSLLLSTGLILAYVEVCFPNSRQVMLMAVFFILGVLRPIIYVIH